MRWSPPDDGWASFARNAVPELVRRNIPVTIFVISERLGDSVDGVTTDRIVTEEQLRELRADGVTIGSHSARHARMTSLDEAGAALELTDSRTGLREILGEDVNLFCFPYGASSPAMVELCRRSGYRRAFTSMPYLAQARQFEIGRMRVDPTDWRLEFHLKLMGAYRWMAMAIALKRRIFGLLRGNRRRIPAAV
jgi:peptidoglycan/xylan/chitin deacetylase (PgdA/CDA1 family)